MIKAYLQNFIALFYPHLCWSCNQNLSYTSTNICLNCQYKLPETNLHLEEDNIFMERFIGRIPLKSAAAFYYFIKGGRLQPIIHKLKYERKPQIGLQLGEQYGHILKEAETFQSIDCIIPVPLHPKRLQQRGYNQSIVFGQGLSNTMNIPIYENVLIRTQMTTSQTKKSRTDRFQNVATAFKVINNNLLKDKHILLVDDVMTTGATLEACGLELIKIEGLQLSFATIGMARH